ncbi:MAG: Xaa-Pro peptidase family protein [Pseudomonadota bacterium]
MSKLAFTQAEFQRRYNAVREKVREKGLSALIVSDNANITYLIGVPAMTASGQAQAAIVSADRDAPYFICRPIDREGAIVNSYASPDDLIGYPEQLIADKERTGHDFIFEFVSDLVGGGKVGMEFDALSLSSYRKAETAFGTARIVDMSGTVNWIRCICSDEEAVIYRQAAKITDAAMETAAAAIRPGVRECDAAAEIIAATVRGVDGYGGDWPYHPEIPTGERIMSPHISWRDDVYPEQGQVNCELGAWRYRYVASLARTISLGEPSDGLKRVFAANAEGIETILPMMRSGSVCQDIWRTYNKIIGKHGYHKESRCGYALGIEWDGFAASLADGDETILQENMVMHVMIGLWVNREESCVLSETVRVTENGPEILGSRPREIIIC